MLMGILGDGYFVWDKQASINFIKPGQSDLCAEFMVTQEMLDSILHQTVNGDKSFPEFVIFVKDNDGNVVSEVKRQLYVRKKPDYRNQTAEEKQAA